MIAEGATGGGAGGADGAAHNSAPLAQLMSAPNGSIAAFVYGDGLADSGLPGTLAEDEIAFSARCICMKSLVPEHGVSKWLAWCRLGAFDEASPTWHAAAVCLQSGIRRQRLGGTGSRAPVSRCCCTADACACHSQRRVVVPAERQTKPSAPSCCCTRSAAYNAVLAVLVQCGRSGRVYCTRLNPQYSALVWSN